MKHLIVSLFMSSIVQNKPLPHSEQEKPTEKKEEEAETLFFSSIQPAEVFFCRRQQQQMDNTLRIDIALVVVAMNGARAIKEH